MGKTNVISSSSSNNDATALEGFIFIGIAISSIAMIFNMDGIYGIVWASVFALRFGSYATSFVSRIPKGILQKQADPYCMSCNHHLERRDLYTIFSYIMSAGRCRFCRVAIPKIIFCTETAVTIAYIVAYMQYGFSKEYVLISSFYFCMIVTIALWMNERYFSNFMCGAGVLLLCMV